MNNYTNGSSGEISDFDQNSVTACGLERGANNARISVFRRIIHGWTYQVYACGLGTGAVYILLYNLRFKNKALSYLQVALLIFNISIFITTSVILACQAGMFPSRARSLISTPATMIFVPILALDLASIIMGLINYAVPADIISWESVETLFYLYIALSICICVPLNISWYHKCHDLMTFTPAWAFLVFPLMLIGVIASRVLSVMPLHSHRAVPVWFLGYMFQGLGTCMTFFYMPIYISRIMQTGFMDGHQANGAFVAAGPPGFTAAALLGLGKLAPEIFKANDLHELMTENVGVIFFGLGAFIAIFMLGLCLLFFLMAVIPYYGKIHKRLNEVLGMWATTFPNVGMTITLRLLGDLFQSEALYGAQLVMTLFVCSAYIVALSCTILAFCQGKILLSSPSQVLADKDQPRGHHGKERPMIHISPPFNKRYSPVNFH